MRNFGPQVLYFWNHISGQKLSYKLKVRQKVIAPCDNATGSHYIVVSSHRIYGINTKCHNVTGPWAVAN